MQQKSKVPLTETKKVQKSRVPLTEAQKELKKFNKKVNDTVEEELGWLDSWLLTYAKAHKITRPELVEFFQQCKVISTDFEKCNLCEFRFACFTLEHPTTIDEEEED